MGTCEATAALDDGGIVRDAIQSAETALRLEEEMRNFEASTEEELARRDAEREQAAEAAEANVVTNEDIIALIGQGLSEAIVIGKIRNSECRFDTSGDGLVALTGAGVSEPIILAMMDARCGG